MKQVELSSDSDITVVDGNKKLWALRVEDGVVSDAKEM